VIAVEARSLHCEPGELRGPDPPLDHPGPAIKQFELDRTGQLAEVVDVLGSAPARQLLMFGRHGR